MKKNSFLSKYSNHKKYNFCNKKFITLGYFLIGLGVGILISFIFTSYAIIIGCGCCAVGFLLIKK
ncbi:MAG: hypothetical protein ACK5LY_01335 [Lachnospirales bacterium]